jgi:hypothetical protein
MTTGSLRHVIPAVVLAAAAVGFGTGALAADPSCSQERNLKSVQSNVPALMIFTNKNADPRATLAVYWIDYSGKRVRYHVLAGGETWQIDTFVGHPWLVAQANFEAAMICEQIFMPIAPIRPVVVGGYPEM